jgi:hypothetical protein
MTLVQLRAGALVICTDILFNSVSEQLAALTLRHAVPAIYQFREFVLSGGLASFGTTVADTYRPLGAYTGRILKGEKPADLPVQQATKLVRPNARAAACKSLVSVSLITERLVGLMSAAIIFAVGTNSCSSSSRFAANSTATDHQYEDRQGAGHHRPVTLVRPRRRVDRITTFFTAAQNVCFWHKADMAFALGDVRFWG